MNKDLMISSVRMEDDKIFYNNIPCLTLKQAAELLNTTEVNLRQIESNNKDKFAEGITHFTLKGEPLKVVILNHNLSPATTILKIYTEKGFYNFVKSVGTDEAWDIYHNVLNVFFRAKELVKSATQIDLMYMMLDEIKETAKKQIEQDQKLNKFEGDLIEAKAKFSELSKKAKAEIIRKEKLAIKNLPDADLNFDQFSKYLKSYLNINIGRDRLYQFVKDLKHIFVDNSQTRSTYTVYQTYLDQGLYKMLVRSYKAKPGSDVKYTYNQIIITPKGQLYLVEKLKANCTTEAQS